MKKTPHKVAYLSRNSVVSEIFPYCPTAQMAEFMFPNVGYRATVYRTGASPLKFEDLLNSDWHPLFQIANSSPLGDIDVATYS